MQGVQNQGRRLIDRIVCSMAEIKLGLGEAAGRPAYQIGNGGECVQNPGPVES